MTRSQITRADLSEKVLAAIRLQPGCASIREVSISIVEDITSNARSWRVTVVDPGASSPEDAYHAAGRVQELLAPRYGLIN